MNRTATRFASIIACALLLGLAFGGCGATRSEPTEESPPAPPTATPQDQAEETPVTNPTPEDESRTPDPDDPDLHPQPVMEAISAAARVAGVDESDVRVLAYTEREWPSTALGCPQPGFSYAQVVTPGYLVQLSAGGTEFEYHTNLTTNVILCSTS